jgi:hypothetical protein
MQRRRLSPLARVAFHVLGQCADMSKEEPVVFSSVMGEIQRTQRILETIATDQPVSPAAFSLSVHNSISGQWSVIHGIKAPMIALSPPDGSAVAALLEAIGILLESTYRAVNVVFYEEDYPEFYSPFLTGPIAAGALALRLVAPELAGNRTRRWKLQASENTHSGAEPGGALQLAPLLFGALKALEIAEPQSTWRLECCN